MLNKIDKKNRKGEQGVLVFVLFESHGVLEGSNGFFERKGS